MNILQPIVAISFASVFVFLAGAQTKMNGDESSFWAEMAWTLAPPIIIFFFAVWCRRKMEKLD
jgi:hypothetical protein